MDDPILFNPDNRLLGGATGDFSLYGGQSDPKFSIQQARDDAPSSQEPSAVNAPAATSPASADAGPDASIPSGTTPEATESGAGSLSPSSFLVTAPEAPFEPLTIAAPATGGPAVSSAIVAPAGAGSPIPVLGSEDAAASPAAAQADAPLITSITESLATLGAANAVPGAVAAATGTVDTVVDSLADTVGVVTGTAATLLDDLAAVVPEGGATAIPPIADAAGPVLDTTIGTVDDTLEGLAGSDPLGGVATLVNLISVSDMFDLNPVNVPLADASGDSGLGLVDALVGEELLPDTLLGATHEDGLLGGDHLDHPLGL